MRVPLAGPANRTGRLAGEHAATGSSRPAPSAWAPRSCASSGRRQGSPVSRCARRGRPGSTPARPTSARTITPATSRAPTDAAQARVRSGYRPRPRRAGGRRRRAGQAPRRRRDAQSLPRHRPRPRTTRPLVRAAVRFGEGPGAHRRVRRRERPRRTGPSRPAGADLAGYQVVDVRDAEVASPARCRAAREARPARTTPGPSREFDPARPTVVACYAGSDPTSARASSRSGGSSKCSTSRAAPRSATWRLTGARPVRPDRSRLGQRLAAASGHCLAHDVHDNTALFTSCQMVIQALFLPRPLPEQLVLR